MLPIADESLKDLTSFSIQQYHPYVFIVDPTS